MVKRLRTFFKGTYIGLILLFLYAPILILIVFSFNSSKTLGHWTGFTLNWYEQLLNTSDNLNRIAESCGFHSSNLLIRAFEKYEGTTPGEFRRKMAQQRK